MNESRTARAARLALRPGTRGEGKAACLALVRLVGDEDLDLLANVRNTTDLAEFLAGYCGSLDRDSDLVALAIGAVRASKWGDRDRLLDAVDYARTCTSDAPGAESALLLATSIFVHSAAA